MSKKNAQEIPQYVIRQAEARSIGQVGENPAVVLAGRQRSKSNNKQASDPTTLLQKHRIRRHQNS